MYSIFRATLIESFSIRAHLYYHYYRITCPPTYGSKNSMWRFGPIAPAVEDDTTIPYYNRRALEKTTCDTTAILIHGNSRRYSYGNNNKKYKIILKKKTHTHDELRK